ncbi:hypothetical protein [Sphingobacterium sp. UME9]|uniref:hypothetical protein n=1 Tax=Sphingobacterium sp. UME9 TaxID=1862316 RepID=UPI0015FF3E5B|nr:hypothetical protein [Sphingobacterium sp. UME9]MBB1644626.1 hypothetical protein [Sphingobacterium sp. UME9]
MGAEKALEPLLPISEFYYQLRLITREIERLHERRTAIANQQQALKQAMYQNKDVNKALKEQLKLIEKQLEVMIS